MDRKDRMSMYSGLEVRVPFCDHRLVEYAYNMPWSVKSLNGREKGIVREAMKGLLPEEILLRKKSPYPKTHNPVYAVLSNSACWPYWRTQTRRFRSCGPKRRVLALAARTDDLAEPWYGQLMRLPQIFAYLLQVDCWLRRYRVSF